MRGGSSRCESRPPLTLTLPPQGRERGYHAPLPRRELRGYMTPWPEGAGAPAGEALLESLAMAQRRSAELVSLRGGQAADRVLGLIRLLADGAGRVILPTRQDIADITDLRFETISRIIKSFERERVLSPLRIAGVHATRAFQIRHAPGC